MKAILLLFMVAACMADDQSDCRERCSKKFGEDSVKEQKESCETGCGYREGALGMFTCSGRCQVSFENSTEASQSCNYACTLPRLHSMTMTVVYGPGDEKPQVNVVQKESIPDSGDSSESAIMMRMPESLKSLFSESHKINEYDDSNSKEAVSDNEDGDSESDRMAAIALRHYMTAQRQQFMNFIQRMNERQQQIQDQAFSGNERPSGHDSTLYGHAVGNVDGNGNAILVSQNMDDDGRRSIVLSLENSRQRRLADLMHGLSMVLGVLAVLIVVSSAALLVRAYRLRNQYRRMHGGGVFTRMEACVPGPVPVKKVPDEGWLADSRPMGVPPPAYDQVSIHSLKKDSMDSEPSTSGESATSPERH